METIDPETLIKESADVKLGKGVFLSVIIHLLLIGLTSFGLYKAWMKWGLVSDKGFNTPNVMKQLEKEAKKNAETQAQDAEAAAEQLAKEKANAEAMSAEEDAAAEKERTATAADKAKAAVRKAEADSKSAAEAAKPQKTPLDQEVAAPPKGFDLNDIDL